MSSRENDSQLRLSSQAAADLPGGTSAARRVARQGQQLRLIRLQHSDDPLAATMATAAALILPRLDRLIELLEEEGRDT